MRDEGMAERMARHALATMSPISTVAVLPVKEKTKRRALITDYSPPERRCAGSMILPGIDEETAGGCP